MFPLIEDYRDRTQKPIMELSKKSKRKIAVRFATVYGLNYKSCCSMAKNLRNVQKKKDFLNMFIDKVNERYNMNFCVDDVSRILMN
jgi:hypothetical protein